MTDVAREWSAIDRGGEEDEMEEEGDEEDAVIDEPETE